MGGVPRLPGVVAVAIIAVSAIALFVATRPADPLAVAASWTERRNAGDVDGAMSLVGERADILGFQVVSEDQRWRLRDLLDAQAIAGWTTVESDCRAAADRVTCRYRIEDVAMRRWGLALTGEHEYVIEDGKIQAVSRTHDPETAERVLAALEAFRAWVTKTHPDSVRTIWSDPRNAGYATPDGARAFVDLLDEYGSR